jgi:hypothetical protein
MRARANGFTVTAKRAGAEKRASSRYCDWVEDPK